MAHPFSSIAPFWLYVSTRRFLEQELVDGAELNDRFCRFQEARKPGMYKDEYIQALFKYYHQRRIESGPGAIETPLVPSWKPEDGSPEHFNDVAPTDDEDDENGGYLRSAVSRMCQAV
jgi:hypothetical protein